MGEILLTDMFAAGKLLIPLLWESVGILFMILNIQLPRDPGCTSEDDISKGLYTLTIYLNVYAYYSLPYFAFYGCVKMLNKPTRGRKDLFHLIAYRPA